MPVTKNQFVNFDDPQYVIELSESPDEKTNYFSPATFFMGNYHPVTMSVIHWQLKQSGPDAKSFHRLSLVLHLFIALLVYWLSFLWTRNELAAGFASLLFALHPMHVESVAWASALKDLLFTLFFIGGLITYWYYNKFEGKMKVVSAIGVFLLFLLSVGSKAHAVVFPIILFLIDWLQGRKFRANVIIEKIPLLIVSGIAVGIGIKAQESAQAIAKYDFGLLTNIQIWFYEVGYYLTRFFVPSHFSVLHPYPDLAEGTPLVFKFALLLILILPLLLYTFYRSDKKLCSSLLFFLIAILPVIQFIPVGYAIVAERYTYLPYIGLGIFASYGILVYLPQFMKALPWLRAIQIGFCITITCLLGWITNHQVKVWENSVTLWSQAVKSHPESYVAQYQLGMAHVELNELQKARPYFESSLAIKSDFVPAINAMARVSSANQNPAEAEEIFSDALEGNPDDIQLLINHGVSLAQQGEFELALAEFNKAAEVDDSFIEIYYNRGMSNFLLSNFDEAIADFDVYLNTYSDHLETLHYRALSYHAKGDFITSKSLFEELLVLDPSNQQAMQLKAEAEYFMVNP